MQYVNKKAAANEMTRNGSGPSPVELVSLVDIGAK